ncbi:MAG: AAA family ATPase [Endomicrobium sp.]|nr:AAA family ATPase [Endomicrobium sp.]
MIIGLTGSYCSGKDTVADYIVNSQGFGHFSLSDIIRDAMKENGIEPTRENLIVFGSNLRAQNGNGVLAKKAISKMEDGKNYCITSIRHPAEVAELRKNGGFVLINVDAPIKTRFARMQKRQREGDPQTLEKFIELEKRESQTSGAGQQLTKTAALADIVFINDFNGVEILYTKIDELLKKIRTHIK